MNLQQLQDCTFNVGGSYTNLVSLNQSIYYQRGTRSSKRPSGSSPGAQPSERIVNLLANVKSLRQNARDLTRQLKLIARSPIEHEELARALDEMSDSVGSPESVPQDDPDVQMEYENMGATYNDHIVVPASSPLPGLQNVINQARDVTIPINDHPASGNSQSGYPTVKWPPFAQEGNDKGSFTEWIECNACEVWYHRGCVGIGPNDPILGDETLYVCPPCEAVGDGSRAVSTVPADLQKEQALCARPDCWNQFNDGEQYFVDCIIGRTLVTSGDKGRFKWLIRWEGYTDNEATWEEESAMEYSHKLIMDFYKKAEMEGLFPHQDPSRTIILQASLDAGCPRGPL